MRGFDFSLSLSPSLFDPHSHPPPSPSLRASLPSDSVGGRHQDLLIALTDSAKLLERRTDDDARGLGARRGRVVGAQRDADPLPGLQLDRRRRRHEDGDRLRERDAVDRSQRRVERHGALEVDAHERERGAADEDHIRGRRRAGPERRGVDDRGPAGRLAGAAAPRSPHAGESVDLERFGDGLDTSAVVRIYILLREL